MNLTKTVAKDLLDKIEEVIDRAYGDGWAIVIETKTSILKENTINLPELEALSPEEKQAIYEIVSETCSEARKKGIEDATSRYQVGGFYPVPDRIQELILGLTTTE